jgi:hypothetical protein
MPNLEMTALKPKDIQNQKTAEEKDLLMRFGQPAGAVVTSTMSNAEFLNQKEDAAQGLYVRKIVAGTADLTFYSKPSEAASGAVQLEARYFPDEQGQVDGVTVSGVWMVASRVDQAQLQSLGAADKETLTFTALFPDGHAFTHLSYELQGLDETVSILRVADHIYEDPQGGEQSHTTVVIMLSDSGKAQPVLANVAISSKHGSISDLHYVLQGKSDAEVSDYLSAYKIAPGGLSMDTLRATVVEATYHGDTAKLNALMATDKIQESGFELLNLPGYSLAPKHAPIWLHGKAEEIRGPDGDVSGVFTANLLEGGRFDVPYDAPNTAVVRREIHTESPFLDAGGQPLLANSGELLLKGEYSQLSIKCQGAPDGQGNPVYAYEATQQVLLEGAANIQFNKVAAEQWVIKTLDGGTASFVNNNKGNVDGEQGSWTNIRESEDDLLEPLDISKEARAASRPQLSAPDSHAQAGVSDMLPLEGTMARLEDYLVESTAVA